MQSVKKARPTVDVHARAFQFACDLVRLYQRLNRSGTATRTLGLQLLRSGTSIGANLAEANAGQSKPDFVAKCSIALKEAHETRYWLRLLKETGLVPPQDGEMLAQEATEIIAILTTILKNSRANPDRG